MTKESLQRQQAPVKDVAGRIERLRETNVLGRIREICAREHVALSDLLGDCRKWRVSRVRHLVWWELTDDRWSLGEIGELFGCDSSAVRVGVYRARKALGLADKPTWPNGRRAA